MRILLLNQCFYPDHVSTAQHLTDLALALVERGHGVTVLTSRRGYDDPTQCFKARETWRGIDVIRIPTLGLSKTAKWPRVLNFASFLFFCFARLMFLPRQDLTVALTSPPLISFFGALFAQGRGGRFCFWVMDLNPDESIAAGWLREDSLVTRVLQALLKYSLRRSDKIIVLDRFMQERIVRKGIPSERVRVVLPWSHDNDIRYDEVGRASFRLKHGLTEKFVIMYSGNHSPCHPLDTLLAAAGKIRTDPKVVFCFVGGGSEFQKVKAFAGDNSLPNVLCMPYQPRNKLSGSLSAADLHVVVMGDLFKGLVHPCKVYNIVGIGAPLLYIGPEESHISDLCQQHTIGLNVRSARHGSVDNVVAHIQSAAAAGPMRVAGAEEVALHFSCHTLLPRMISVLEHRVAEANLEHHSCPSTSVKTPSRHRT
jgi:putative colanic acid biosynthesis glycosyltransferase WcaI